MAGLDIKLKKIAQVNNAGLVELSGAIDGNTIVEFQSSLDDIQKTGISKLVLDFSEVKYVNSTGLGSLVKYADAFRHAGGGVALMNVPAKVKIVIDMLGLNAFLKMCPNLESALEAIEQVAAPQAPPSVTPTKAPVSTRGSLGGRSNPPAPISKNTGTAVAPPPSQPKQTMPPSVGSGLATTCRSCSLEMEIPKPGTYQCPRCFTLITYAPNGEISFKSPEGPQPITMVLNCSPLCTEGLRHFINGFSRRLGLPDNVVMGLDQMIIEISEILRQHVYEGKEDGHYHLMIDASNSKLKIRISDYGKTISPNLKGSLFRKTQQIMPEFECIPHPKGGNIINLARPK
ncbi:MAG: STAS domain-containing protein [Planctomycetota bacterium]|nr:MAG: STAS domain-containing protein [Planctomycetota bacterium]